MKALKSTIVRLSTFQNKKNRRGIHLSGPRSYEHAISLVACPRNTQTEQRVPQSFLRMPVGARVLVVWGPARRWGVHFAPFNVRVWFSGVLGALARPLQALSRVNSPGSSPPRALPAGATDRFCLGPLRWIPRRFFFGTWTTSQWCFLVPSYLIITPRPLDDTGNQWCPDVLAPIRREHPCIGHEHTRRADSARMCPSG